MQILLLGRGVDGVEGAQLEGFRMYERQLIEHGIFFRRLDLPALFSIERTIRASTDDVAFVMVGWNEPKEEVVSTFERLHRLESRPRIVFLDHYAQSSSPFLDVVPYVDRYAKRQVLVDRSKYRHDLEGGYVFTDFFARWRGFDLDGWHFGSKLPEGHDIVHAWNLGVLPRYRRWVGYQRLLRWTMRPIDIHCRLEIGRHSRAKWEWYQEYRTLARDAVEPLERRYRLSEQRQVRRFRYFLELAHSKLVFSPFGWGEVCIRDFEAVAAGALLVKPSMEHLATSPDIYRPFETYVPVAWDLSDLEEKCTYYLEHPAEARAIAENARSVLRDYFEKQGFLRDVFRVLEGLEVSNARRAVDWAG
jgi:hypothetical protein